MIDADLAKLIDDDGDALAVLLAQDALQQRGFSGAEIAREDTDRRGSVRHGQKPFG
jgi:hypothetical protein